MSDLLDSPEGRRRAHRIHEVFGEGMHDITQDKSWGCDEEEHARRHQLYTASFLTGLIYALDYKGQAEALLEYIRPVGALTAAPVDVFAGRVYDLLPRKELRGDALIEHFKGVLKREPHGGEIEPVVPTFDHNGDLKWELVEGKSVFPMWEESDFMEWPDDG